MILKIICVSAARSVRSFLPAVGGIIGEADQRGMSQCSELQRLCITIIRIEGLHGKCFHISNVMQSIWNPMKIGMACIPMA